jgi:hypothetical protein
VIFALARSPAVCRIVDARSTYCDIDVSRRDLTTGCGFAWRAATVDL